MNNKLLLTPAETMELLGVGRNTMYCNLLKREDFPKILIGRKIYVNKEKLQEWLDNQCQ